MKSVWNGNITFALVSIPVKLYNVASPRKIKLVTLDKNGHKIYYKRWCKEENREVEWSEVQKGFELKKGQYIILTKEDLENIKLKSTKDIEILGFIDKELIDPVYIEKSYYVIPNGSEKAYNLFYRVLQLTGKYGIGKVVIKEKERILAIRAYKNAIVAHSLYYQTDINDPTTFSELYNLPEISQKEIELAKNLISKMSIEDFDINKFADQYTEALKELIKAKIEGKEFKIEEKVEKKESNDLEKALEESIKMKSQ
jgi:DNA end-binding protein Ku